MTSCALTAPTTAILATSDRSLSVATARSLSTIANASIADQSPRWDGLFQPPSHGTGVAARAWRAPGPYASARRARAVATFLAATLLVRDTPSLALIGPGLRLQLGASVRERGVKWEPNWNLR